tara:strand:- start:1016 stop:1171 length:156 start_codon:yes stop_codon:yes gene_type:complete
MKDKSLFLNLPFLIILFDINETEEMRSGPEVENLNIFLIRKINGIAISKVK